jgi:hypothetical protein
MNTNGADLTSRRRALGRRNTVMMSALVSSIGDTHKDHKEDEPVPEENNTQ